MNQFICSCALTAGPSDVEFCHISVAFFFFFFFFPEPQKPETACQTFCEVCSSSPALASIMEQMAAINFLICSQSDSKYSCPYTWN